MTKEHYIECPKFGGFRPAPACVHFDRYKTCRRRCRSLQAHLEKHPDFTETVKGWAKIKEKSEQPLLFSAAKFSGKNLPDATRGCRFCNFVGKSPRGLSMHMVRSHGQKKRAQYERSPSAVPSVGVGGVDQRA